MFDSRIPQEDYEPTWLSDNKGPLTFSNGLRMGHDANSKANADYQKAAPDLRSEFTAEPRRRWMTLSGLGWTKTELTAGVQGPDAGAVPRRVYYPPVFDCRIVTTGPGLSAKAVLAILTSKPEKPSTAGQPLRFSNGTRTSHSEESKALQAYERRVASGKEKIPGLVVEFTGPNGGKVVGPANN